MTKLYIMVNHGFFKYQIGILCLFLTFLAFFISCNKNETPRKEYIQHVNGKSYPNDQEIWLSHEHILVDFIGADEINSKDWNKDSVIANILPFLNELKKHNVQYFVDATPNYLGRDVQLLEKISELTKIKILTNTGFYGARNNKYIPSNSFGDTPEELAEIWIEEFVKGIDGSGIKPGFIKISVDENETLDTFHRKIVEAAGITHNKTGLTIASHTGKAFALWPQLEILEEQNVPLNSFIWVHAQNETENANYIKAAQKGCWISLDGLGWETENHIQKIIFAKENGFLDQILISHDAGWYDPQKDVQEINGFTNLFKIVIPELKERGFTDAEFKQLLSLNPSRAFSIQDH